jgi:hypothetical protein
MTPFEYLILLISIILALGITTILKGVAALIKQTRLAGLYAPYIIWITLVFVIHIHEWWVVYGLKAAPAWTLYKILFVILYPVTLYVLAHLLFPDKFKEHTSKEFYQAHYPRLFVVAILLAMQSIAHNLIFNRQAIQTHVPHLIVLLVLSTMVTRRSKSDVVHTVVSLLLLAMAIASIVMEQRVVY